MKTKGLKIGCVAIAVFMLTPLCAQNIVVDGSDTDWASVPILSEPGVFPYVKVLNSSQKIVEPSSDSVQNVVYMADTTTIFPNPERGFYHMCEYTLKQSNNSADLSISGLQAYRTEGISLILREYYLSNFKTTDLTDNALQRISGDMQLLRSAGLKCILRFAYTADPEGTDASLEQMKAHLDQLRPYLSANADVIAVMQAGFIGAWGEWYYSSNLGTPPAKASRNALLDKILSVLPSSRMVQVRTPKHKADYIGDQVPLNDATAFQNTARARVGHHNDCFLASETDYGTYTNPATDKAYLNEDCLYVPIGGETCPPSGIDPADATTAQAEMRLLRFSYLNMDYYSGVNDGWGTYINNVKRELGYRFQLLSGSYPKTVLRGNSLPIQISLQNKGYASPYNQRVAQIVLQNISTNDVFTFTLQSDPRFWKPLQTQQISENIVIPYTMPVGTYKLYLNLPDASETLSANAAFSIRCANANVWNSATGYNDLQAQITVE